MASAFGAAHLLCAHFAPAQLLLCACFTRALRLLHTCFAPALHLLCVCFAPAQVGIACVFGAWWGTCISWTINLNLVLFARFCPGGARPLHTRFTPDLHLLHTCSTRAVHLVCTLFILNPVLPRPPFSLKRAPPVFDQYRPVFDRYLTNI